LILATVHRCAKTGARRARIESAGLPGAAGSSPGHSPACCAHRNPTVRETPRGPCWATTRRAFLTEPLITTGWGGDPRRHLLLTDFPAAWQEKAPALGKPVLVLRRTTEKA